MLVLYRALVTGERRDDRTLVFFESTAADPAAALRGVLQVLWNRPEQTFEVSLCAAVDEVLAYWAPFPGDPWCRLFELGAGGDRATPARTLFLVRAHVLRELQAAQARMAADASPAWIELALLKPARGQLIRGRSDAGEWVERFDPEESSGFMTHWRPEPPVLPELPADYPRGLPREQRDDARRTQFWRGPQP